ncbi:MAG: hypothetical protein FWG57_04020 [Endomicrobia bacterium]|nr:hypothetical protein [Endomicrobiia bacterium]
MKKILLTALFLIMNTALFAKSNDIWIAFENEDADLIGYKDKNGVIKIEPKFIVGAGKFENIMAVVEETYDNKWNSYYLTKTGKTAGKDSLYYFDNNPDCESEGFIRFRDHKTDKAGMLNKDGDIVIPAEYSDLTRVRNGMIIALKDAVKKYSGEHYTWTGGQELLIDTSNNILIDNFPYDDNLNFFSIKKTKTPHSDPIRKSFLARDGYYWSFIDFKKEFKNWLTNDLLVNLTRKKLLNASHNTIVWEYGTWDSTEYLRGENSRAEFINNNFEILKAGLLEILDPNYDYFISRDSLNTLIYEAGFEKYFNNCGEFKDWIYPVMTIVISHTNGNDFTQNFYEFLRTDKGYKLISAAIRNANLRI